ncbi:MAG TPA: DUF624 domain-containing protein [Clostridiales bacterium]|nr:DUF624 domain-containing protein [Clostridiales bacterium]
MSGIFKYDNAFFRIMTKVAYIFYLNALWLLFSIPIITIGAATAALNSVALKMVREEEGALTKSFLKSFRQNFKQATLIWLVFFVAFVVLIGDIYYFAYIGGFAGTLCAGIFFMLALVAALAFMMVFHLQAYFCYNVRGVLAASFKMALGHLVYSLALLVLFCCILYGIYVSVFLMVVLTFFGAGIFSMISAYLMRKIFDQYG